MEEEQEVRTKIRKIYMYTEEKKYQKVGVKLENNDISTNQAT